MGVFYMSLSKSELILGQLSPLFKWTSVYSILSTLACIVSTDSRQITLGSVGSEDIVCSR